MTFEEWLRSDDGISRFGVSEILPLAIKAEWVADARIGWNAAIEAAARVCDDQANEPECPERAIYCAIEVRALSSNAALTG